VQIDGIARQAEGLSEALEELGIAVEIIGKVLGREIVIDERRRFARGDEEIPLLLGRPPDAASTSILRTPTAMPAPRSSWRWSPASGMAGSQTRWLPIR
jgi:hypothetical protein